VVNSFPVAAATPPAAAPTFAALGNAEYAPGAEPGAHRPQRRWGRLIPVSFTAGPRQRTGPGAIRPRCANLPAPAPGWRSVEYCPRDPQAAVPHLSPVSQLKEAAEGRGPWGGPAGSHVGSHTGEQLPP
jgi:hypothetical protein